MKDSLSNTFSSETSFTPLLFSLITSSSFQYDDMELEAKPLSFGLNAKRDDMADTSNFYSARFPLEIEKFSINAIAEYEKNQKKILLKNITDKLAAKLSLFAFDDESMESIWKICDSMQNNIPVSVVGEALQRIYLEYNDYPNVLCGICRLLSSFEMSEVTPWGQMILIGLLNHKHETVKEYAVVLLDNWKDSTFIPVLKNLDCHSAWLRAYIDEVLQSLEG